MGKKLIRSMMCPDCEGEGSILESCDIYCEDDCLQDHFEQCSECEGTGFCHDEVENELAE